jgi:4-amino-4-deoxy-L-arabinose transferase-like glycosyltransferase
MNIWQQQEALSRRLLAWAGLSIVLGLVFSLGNKFWRGVGSQFLGWGVTNALIALFGQAAARQRVANLENPGLADVQAQEAEKLSRLLWINAGLDVLYMLGGRSLGRRDKGDGRMKGMGLGVVLQALFLLAFDVFHAREVDRERRA